MQDQIYSIDEFQREYKWTRENIEELLTDLNGKFQSSYRSGDLTSQVASYDGYFLGSIIVSKRDGKNYLIDGQQRITSLTLLLIYLYRSAHEQYRQVADALGQLIYSDNLGTHQFNLDIAERLPVIAALFKAQPLAVNDQDESTQTMFARYNDIEAIDLSADLDEALPHFGYWLMTKVGVIEIAADSDKYAYEIFETMNDRGKSLSPVDMLKAYLLAPIGESEKRRLANQIWKKHVLDLISWRGETEPERDANCIKAWLRAQHAESIRDRRAGATDKDWELIGSVFHRWARDNRERLHIGSAEQNLTVMERDLPFFAKAYLRILEADTMYKPELKAIFYNAHNEFTWQSTVLLAPLCASDDSITVDRKLAATAIYSDIWLMRRVVNYVRVGYSSTAYAMWLLCKDIRRKSLDNLVQILTEKLTSESNEISFDGIPSRGRLGITDLRLNQFSRRYIFHLLARLTSYV
jgi:uncharacterized protein with ParB-like and HNH nuclease domain